MNKSKYLRLGNIEPLEQRCMMATFGTPWPAPRSLSVSFPTDQASVGAFPNTIRETLDQVADRLVWQEAVLRAFQTWSVHANINIGIVPDRGDDFGAVGLTSNDPRFGEFRIGAFPQSSVLANALPFQVTAGTWSGDVLVNTNTNLFLADWSNPSSIQVPAPNEKGPAVELYSLLLHEAGNALGLPDNSIPRSVMNGTYSGPRGALTASDINAIRLMYGPRRDIYEPRSNPTITSATLITNPSSFTGDSPLVVQGSINTRSDVDVYRLNPIQGKDRVSIRLFAAGISMLKAKLEVLDSQGNVLADSKVDSIFNNNMEIEVSSLGVHPRIFIRVSSNSSDVFGIGDYRLEVDYRSPDLQPTIQPPPHDSDAVDEDNGIVDFVSVDALFATIGIVDLESAANDQLSTATILESTPGYLSNTRYEAQSSLSTASDRDFWKFRSPSVSTPSFHIQVDPLGTSTTTMDVIVLNENGDRIASRFSRKADGGILVSVMSPTPNTNYVVLVRSAATSIIKTGNYQLSVSFATTPPSSLREVYSGNVQNNTESVSRFETTKTQLFRFDLAAISPDRNRGVQLSIYDARTGDIVAAFSAAGGTTHTEYLWLGSGAYFFRTSYRSRNNAPAGDVSFRLRADVLSDDQGPRPINPLNPPPDWTWQNSTGTPPVVNNVEPPFVSPWGTNFNYSLYLDYYRIFLSI